MVNNLFMIEEEVVSFYKEESEDRPMIEGQDWCHGFPVSSKRGRW